MVSSSYFLAVGLRRMKNRLRMFLFKDRMKNSIVAEMGFYSTATDSFDTNEMEIRMQNAMLSLKQLFLLIKKPELLGLKSSDSVAVKEHGHGVVC